MKLKKKEAKMRLKTLALGLMVLALLSILIPGCAGEKPAPTAPTTTAAPTPSKVEWPKTITIGASEGTTSPSYLYGVAIADLINRNIPGVSATAVNVQGMVARYMGVIDKKYEFMHASAATALLIIYNPKEQPELTGKMGPIRQLMLAERNCGHVLAVGGINSVADLRGKKGLYTSPSTSTMLMFDAVFEAAGMTHKDVVGMPRPGISETCAALVEKTVDFGQIWGGVPMAELVEVMKKRSDIHLLQMDPVKTQAAMNKYNPGITIEKVPAGAYPNQKEDVYQMWSRQMFITNKDTPDSMAYQLVKLYHDNLDFIHKVHVSYAEVTPAYSVARLFAPIHPGAKKYYSEKGLWTAELEAQNSELLKVLGEK